MNKPPQNDEPKGPAAPGIRCPTCGCQHLLSEFNAGLPVANTIRLPGAVRRYRICRHCGRRVRTRELIDEAARPKHATPDG